MNELGWEPEEMQAVLRIVAAVLTLGNIKFSKKGEGSSIANSDGSFSITLYFDGVCSSSTCFAFASSRSQRSIEDIVRT
jgi:myosin heavy subunit